MNTVVILNPMLKERFDKLVEHFKSENKPKPDNVTWEEVTFIYMLTLAKNFYVQGNDIEH